MLRSLSAANGRRFVDPHRTQLLHLVGLRPSCMRPEPYELMSPWATTIPTSTAFTFAEQAETDGSARASMRPPSFATRASPPLRSCRNRAAAAVRKTRLRNRPSLEPLREISPPRKNTNRCYRKGRSGKTFSKFERRCAAVSVQLSKIQNEARRSRTSAMRAGYCAGDVKTTTLAKFLAAARAMAGPPMSMASIDSSSCPW